MESQLQPQRMLAQKWVKKTQVKHKGTFYQYFYVSL